MGKPKRHVAISNLILLMAGLCLPKLAPANECCQFANGCVSAIGAANFQNKCVNVGGAYNNNKYCETDINSANFATCQPKPGGSAYACVGTLPNNACSAITGIPTVSTWGITILGLLTVVAATIVIMRRRARAVA